MNLEVVQISKVKKQTEKGVVDIYKATLKGFEFKRDPESGYDVAVVGKLTLESASGNALDNYILQKIGDTRNMQVMPINRSLDEFQQRKAESTE